MGGDYYDRPVQQAQNQEQAYSEEAQQLFQQKKEMHQSLNPINYKDKKLICKHKNPIVFALDVTGSMGEWAKVIYDKLPMFYGQIMMKGYLAEPAISFCAIGDATTEDPPLQVTGFGQGKQIDELIKKMLLWVSGGGNNHESYEIAAYFYINHCELHNAQKPYFFITGDEQYFDILECHQLEKIIGKRPQETNLNSLQLWKKLKETYNVFHLHKPYLDQRTDAKVVEQWQKALGNERVLKLKTPKACIDVMLGAIALSSGARTLNQYIQDMEDRGQDEQRIEEVSNSLQVLWNKLHGEQDQQGYENYNEEQKMEDNQVNFIDQARLHVLPKLKNQHSEHQDQVQKFKDLLQQSNKQMPNEFICSITYDVMVDPVIAEDGNSYDRQAIITWFESHDTSPLTGLKVQSKNLIPNLALKKLIYDFFEELKKNK